MQVKYKGKKEKVGIPLPVGKGQMSKMKYADPFCDLPDDDAKRLVKLDPTNFELVTKSKKSA